ncbi:hypothetical protein [Niveispirillum sp. KHB5.9]|uniref:hypothetical protein n=1 Tax=Niveispirillum sp. KHB5.9 TaxID=3400269 RepID=UPI003A86ADBD
MPRIAAPILALTLFLAMPALGADKPGRGPMPAAPPAELAAWAAPVPDGLSAGASVDAAPVIAPGKAVELALRPEGGVKLAATPGKVGTGTSFAGLFSLTVDRPGTWRVALGKAAWIDLVKDGAAIASTAHGHGPACTGIRKIVDFDLKPGRYLIQLSASPADRMTALVLPPA